ncbi:hypothetical protein Ahy_A02g008759 [Arachis hypogaea]|uniref:Uncharacterized protein n=1 Tax=Arachis hypogaea TaxID=3818 RepID=A0A445EF44_ARAHY|nr:hypothetical protein Ahy_A02g008759 [Arachis hypogaea]
MLGSEEEEEYGGIIGDKRLEGMGESEGASEDVRMVSGRRRIGGREDGCDGSAGRPGFDPHNICVLPWRWPMRQQCQSEQCRRNFRWRLAKDGIERSRAEIFLKIYKRLKDGRPLDEKSAKAELIEEKLNNDKLSNEEFNNGVAWEGDVYSQVLRSDRSGYIPDANSGHEWCYTAVGFIVSGFAVTLA